MRYDIYKDREDCYYGIKEGKKVYDTNKVYVGTMESNDTFRSLLNLITNLDIDNEFDNRIINDWEDYSQIEKLVEQYHKELNEDGNDEDGYIMCLCENFIPDGMEEYDGMFPLDCISVLDF